ncbi:MAG TPA: acyltransferase [Acidobacteriaceae bacterium]|jgi:peptidoglycan/LPS O-acetylase OafA/YrhL|nr:acyltransferase [Acidobacteriaceae bacterium]
MSSSLSNGLSTGAQHAARHGKTARMYWPELDALRFFAFAMVFCSHAPISRPWYRQVSDATAFGVSIFFCLSAYLIVTLLLKEREETGRVRIGAFAIRRILRIWPPYFAVLAIAYGIGMIFPTVHIAGRGMAAMSLLIGNLYVIHHGWLSIVMIAPLWSISLEEQFYLGVPFLTSIGGRRAILSICLVTIAVAYGVLCLLGAKGEIPIWQIWANSFVEFQFFAAGGLIALFFYGRRPRLPLPVRLFMMASGLACFYVAAARFNIHSWRPAPVSSLVLGYICALAGTALILIATLNLNVRVPSIVVYFGKISYGLYLIHTVVLFMLFSNIDAWPREAAYFSHHKLLGIPLAMALTAGIASLSYRYFERPILRLKNRFETVKTRPA